MQVPLSRGARARQDPGSGGIGANLVCEEVVIYVSAVSQKSQAVDPTPKGLGTYLA